MRNATVLTLLLVLVAGCVAPVGSRTATPTPSPTATLTPTATATPEPGGLSYSESEVETAVNATETIQVVDVMKVEPVGYHIVVVPRNATVRTVATALGWTAEVIYWGGQDGRVGLVSVDLSNGVEPTSTHVINESIRRQRADGTMTQEEYIDAVIESGFARPINETAGGADD